MYRSLLKKMKTGSFFSITLVVLTALSTDLFAQQGKNIIKIGSATAFAQNFLNTKSQYSRTSLIIPTTESQLPVVINVVTTEGIRGTIAGDPSSNFFIDYINGKLQGKVVLPAVKKAYNYFSDAAGNVFVEEVDINKVICVNMYNGPMEPASEIGSRGQSDPIPDLESFPGAEAVIYLDFDGQVVTGGKWNGGKTIDAEPANLSASQMTNAWNVVSEDYRPYKINITTKEAVYLAAPEDKRMRCVITPTDIAAPGTGGIAYIGSFSAGNSDKTPCWVFNLGGNGKTTGETCSHELGHTVGLDHDGLIDGTEYYSGHNMWSPIMGNGYSKTVTQWSKGQYKDANNSEDDVIIIGEDNGFTFRTDEAGNTIAKASPLKIETDNMTILAAKNYGVITQDCDVDVYSFNTWTGKVIFNIDPSPDFPDLDVKLSIINAEGGTVITDNSNTSMGASISTTLPAGTYYLKVDGTGDGTDSTGYTDYGSIGAYTIKGSVVALATGIAKSETNKNNITLYPNPANEQINIKLGNAGITNTINIVNMLGQSLYTRQSDEQSLNVNLSAYNKGIYFITISNVNGTSTSKFIKE